MEQPFHRWNAGRQSQHDHLVIGLDLEIIGGDVAFAVAGDAADDGIDGHGQLPDGFAGDRRASPDLKLHNIGIDAAEAFQRGDFRAQGVFHHVTRRDEFLVDDGVDSDVL